MRHPFLVPTLLLLAGCSNRRQALAAREPQYDQAAGVPAVPSEQALPSRAVHLEYQQQPAAAPMPTQQPSEPSSRALRGPMLIKTATVQLRVDTLERAMVRLGEIARAVGAVTVSSSTVGGRDERQSASVALRLAPEALDRTLEGLRRIGIVEGEQVESEDVGEEFVDVTARLTNGRRLEQRLLNLLATRTGKLSDVVQIEHELAQVRSELDVLEGRQRYLRDRVALSTLTINLHEPATIVGVPGPGIVAQSVDQAWENFVWLMALLIRSLGVVVPLGAMAAMLFGLWKRFGPREQVSIPSILPASSHGS